MALGLLALAAAGYFRPWAFDAAGVLGLLAIIIVATDLALTSRALRGLVSLRRDFPRTGTVASPRNAQYVIDNQSGLAIKCQVHPDSYP